MDADGLPLIGPSVDYEKVAPINQKKTVEYLNHFIIHTAGFLNQFSTVCEEKLASLSERIERLHVQMTLLEGKINSIPGLQSLSTTAPTTTTTTTTATSQLSEQTTSKTNTTQNISLLSHSETNSHQNKSAPPTEAQAKEESVKEQPTMTVSQHPTYVKYFKMLNFGVPIMAVKQKMAAEGLNPDLLDTPSAPMPDGSTVTTTAATTENNDDFSDDDDDEEEEEDSDGSASFSD